jgi:hypothetical protein
MQEQKENGDEKRRGVEAVRKEDGAVMREKVNGRREERKRSEKKYVWGCN